MAGELKEACALPFACGLQPLVVSLLLPSLCSRLTEIQTLDGFTHWVAGELKEACALPFACVLQPFARLAATPHEQPCAVAASDISRCHDCLA